MTLNMRRAPYIRVLLLEQMRHCSYSYNVLKRTEKPWSAPQFGARHTVPLHLPVSLARGTSLLWDCDFSFCTFSLFPKVFLIVQLGGPNIQNKPAFWGFYIVVHNLWL